jgi:branched-chain amino acid aminotransferase
VLEAPTSSIFWVAGSTVFTPPLSDHILASITRAVTIELADAQERSCTFDELLAAAEAFLVSTTRELQPVASIDGRAIGTGEPGAIARDLGDRLHQRILSELG